MQKTPIVINFPGWVYDLTQFAFFPVNYAIGGLCHLQPTQSEWNNVEVPDSPAKHLETVKEQILSGNEQRFNERDLVALFDSLPVVSAQEGLIGYGWKGRILPTGSSVLDLAQKALVSPLLKLGFRWGKRYLGEDKGDPLILRWKDKIYIPVPIWGNVGMTDIRWRKEPTATMNYDHQPWKDYFRLLHADGDKVVLLGVWTHKQIAGGWFTLSLDKNMP